MPQELVEAMIDEQELEAEKAEALAEIHRELDAIYAIEALKVEEAVFEEMWGGDEPPF